MNKVCLSGRLIKDPIFQPLKNNNSLCVIFIANNEYYGENARVGFYKVKVWGKLAEVVKNHCRTGVEIFLSGRLEQWRYEDENGKTVYDNSIVMEQFNFGNNRKSESEAAAG